MATFFNEYFGIERDVVENYGAFNVSIINDLPLFIDPFLLFNSKKPEYQAQHDQILRYMFFLRDAIAAGRVNPDLLKAWFFFPEVKQNWLGFSLNGNGGTGLGLEFANALHANLVQVFANPSASAPITSGAHIEKICLIQSGVGRDNISDFATNLLKDFLCSYTEAFAKKFIDAKLRRAVPINKAYFDYATESWMRKTYELPIANGDFVLLTPRDILTRDENWINRSDMIRDFQSIPMAIPDAELRGQVFNYFASVLYRDRLTRISQKDRDEAAIRTIAQFPQLLDYYIKQKEDSGGQAESVSSEKVNITQKVFIDQVGVLQQSLAQLTNFYDKAGDTYIEAHERVAYLKDVIENKGGHRIFYHNGVAIQRESDLQIIFRFVWFGSPSDVGTEANDGRGPVDYKISRGAADKTLIEMKLAKNSALERVRRQHQ